MAADIEQVELAHLPGVHAEEGGKLRRRVARAVNRAVDDPAERRDLLRLRGVEQGAVVGEEVCQVLHRHVPAACDQVNIGRMIRHEQQPHRLLVHAEHLRDLAAAARRGHGAHVRERLQHGRLLARRGINHARHGGVGEHFVDEEIRENGQRHAAGARVAVLRVVIEQQLLGIRCVHAEKVRERLRRPLLRERGRVGEFLQRLEVCRHARVEIRREGGVIRHVLCKKAQKLPGRDSHGAAAAVDIIIDHAQHIGTDRDAGIERADDVGHLRGGVLPAERGGVRHGALDVRVGLEPVRQRGHGVLVGVVVQHDDGVIRREHLRDRVGIRERVGDLGRQLQNVRAREQQHERRRDRAATPVAEAAERREHAPALALGRARLFRRPADELIRPQDQAGQHREHAQQTAQHTLGQYDAEIHADLEAHEHQHQQAHDRRDRAAGDRAERRRERARHGGLAVGVGLQLLPVAVHEDDGIVHRERELQNSRDARRDVRRLAEENIRALVDEHGDADRDEKQHRLEIRRAGDEQNDRQNRQREDDDDRRDVRRRGVVAAHGHVVVGEAVGHVALDLRLLVGVVVILRRELVERGVAAVIVVAVRLVGHAVHVRDLRQLLADGKLVARVQPAEHDADGVRLRHVGEGLVHAVHADLHLRAVRQVLGHVGVDADEGHQRRTDHRQSQHDNKQQPAFFDDESCDLLHGWGNSFRARQRIEIN